MSWTNITALACKAESARSVLALFCGTEGKSVVWLRVEISHMQPDEVLYLLVEGTGMGETCRARASL